MHFSKERLDKLSDISISTGQVFFASAFIEPIIGGNFHWSSLLAGLGFSALAWWIALLFIKI